MWRSETGRVGLVTLTLLVGALGCGGKEGSSHAGEPPSGTLGTVPTSEGSYMVPPLAPSTKPAPQLPSPPPEGYGVPPTASVDQPNSATPGLIPEHFGPSARTDAAQVLVADCGGCHSPGALLSISGGIDFIGDIDRLVSRGLIIPLNSAASPLVRAMRDGSMPPLDSGNAPASAADIEVVTRFIDNVQFWPSPRMPERDAGSPEVQAADAGPDGG